MKYYTVKCEQCGKKSVFDCTGKYEWKNRQNYETVQCNCGYTTVHHVPVMPEKP